MRIPDELLVKEVVTAINNLRLAIIGATWLGIITAVLIAVFK